MNNPSSIPSGKPHDSQGDHATFIIDPITGEKTYLRPRVERINADLEAKKTLGKPPDVWSVEELGQAMGVSRGPALDIMRDLHSQYAEGKTKAYCLGLNVPVEAIVSYNVGAIGYGIKREWGEKIALAYKTIKGPTRDKPAGYWSAAEFGEAIQKISPNITNPDATGRMIIRQLRDQLETNEAAYYKNVPITKDAIAIYDYRRLPSYAIRWAEGQKIVDAYAIKKHKPKGFWSTKEFGLAIQRQAHESKDCEKIAYNILSALRNQLKTNDVASYKDVSIEKDAIAEYHHNESAYAIRQQEGEKLASAYISEKDPSFIGYWSTEKLDRAIKEAHPLLQDSKGVGSRMIYDIRQQHKKDKGSAYYREIPIPEDAIIAYKNKGRFTYAIREKEAQLIVAVCAAEERGIPEGILTAEMLAKEMTLNVITARNVIKDIRTQLADNTHAEYRGLQIPPQAIIEYRTKTNTTGYGIEESWGKKIASAYKAEKGEERGIPPGIWSSSEFEASMGMAERTGKQVIKKLRDQVDNGQPFIDYMGLQIPSTAIVKYTTNSGTPAYGIEQLWGEKIAANYKAEKGEERGKPTDVWSAEELGNAMGLTKIRAFQIIRGFRNQFASGHHYVEYLGVQIPSAAIRKYEPKVGSTGYGIEKTYGERIALAYKAERGKNRGTPAGVLSTAEIADALELSENRIKKVVWELRKQISSGQEYAVYLGLHIPPTAIIKYTTDANHSTYGLQQEWGERLIAAYRVQNSNIALENTSESTREEFRAKPLTPRKSPAHMTEEERAEAKRGPKGRGQ